MTSEFQPKKIKLEILKTKGTQGNKQIIKLIPFGGTSRETKGKTYFREVVLSLIFFIKLSYQ